MPLLELRDVTKKFTAGPLDTVGVTAVNDLSFSIETDPPLITTVIGESGSGKTTLARLLLGLMQPSTGSVMYQGQPMTRMGRRRWHRFIRDVQVIFQDPYEVFNPFYKVDRVLEAPVRQFGLARGPVERRELITSTLEAVGLRPDETLGRRPHQLSGGQRQRVMVARALLLRPKLIVADEPVSMMDASLRATVLGTLQKLNSDYDIALLYITHDIATAYQISHQIMVMYRGHVVEVGDAARVVDAPSHPYTKLLINSTPIPDPSRRWGDSGVRTARRPAVTDPGTACPFLSRCLAAMERCARQAPPMFKLDDLHASACYLEDGSVTTSVKEVLNNQRGYVKGGGPRGAGVSDHEVTA